MKRAKEHIFQLSESPLIILYKEGATTSIELLNICFDELEKITDQRPFNMIIDLSIARPPRTEVRHEIKSRFNTLNSEIESLSLIVGNNFIIKIAAQFVFRGMVKTKTTQLCKTVEIATEEIKKRYENR